MSIVIRKVLAILSSRLAERVEDAESLQKLAKKTADEIDYLDLDTGKEMTPDEKKVSYGLLTRPCPISIPLAAKKVMPETDGRDAGAPVPMPRDLDSFALLTNRAAGKFDKINLDKLIKYLTGLKKAELDEKLRSLIHSYAEIGLDKQLIYLLWKFKVANLSEYVNPDQIAKTREVIEKALRKNDLIPKKEDSALWLLLVDKSKETEIRPRISQEFLKELGTHLPPLTKEKLEETSRKGRSTIDEHPC